MFQYNGSETIINSMIAKTDSYGTGATQDRIVAKSGLINILRYGEYKFEGIVGGKIYKTPGVEGSTGSVALNLVSGGSTLFTNPGVYRLAIYIGMNNKFLADFAYANWYKFGKPIIVEFEVTTVNNNGAALSALIASAIKDAVPYNNVFAKAVDSTGTVTVMLTDPYAHIKGVTLDYYEPTSCDSCVGAYVPVAVPTQNLVITKNQEPFGTAAWIQENLRFPTLQNLRYNALYKDEMPMAGATYTQYSFLYEAKRDIGGVSVVGQANTTITRHVLYVANNVVAAFEAKLGEAFGDNVIIENFSTMILSAPTIANDGVAVQLTAEVYPADSSVTIAFASANLPANVTLTADGILTATSSATVNATFEVTATPSDAAYKPVTRTFTVIAG